MRPPAILLLAACVLSSTTEAQDSTHRSWAFDASLWGYIVRDDADYLSAIFTADRRWLHLEARYNYEALRTGSGWLGYNFEVGSTVTIDITPMVGLLIGGITGSAPGYEVTVDWWKLSLSTDGEYVFDLGDVDNSFFYVWSQLGISPVNWLEAGIAIQRTRAYQTDRDLQRGFFATLTYQRFYGSGYVFNPDDDTPTAIIAAGVTF